MNDEASTAGRHTDLYYILLLLLHLIKQRSMNLATHTFGVKYCTVSFNQIPYKLLSSTANTAVSKTLMDFLTIGYMDYRMRT